MAAKTLCQCLSLKVKENIKIFYIYKLVIRALILSFEYVGFRRKVRGLFKVVD